MNDKVLIITIFSLLGIGFIAILFVAVPWFTNYLLPNWKDTLIDSGIVVCQRVIVIFFGKILFLKVTFSIDWSALPIALSCNI